MIDGDTEPGTAPYASGGGGTFLEHLYGAILGLPEPSSWQTAAWSMISTVRDLIERPVNFRYGYNMTCEHCGGITPLTADTHHRERHHAHIKCAHCPADIHYRPYAMTPRDADDPVLNHEAALRAPWHHTRT